LAVKLDVMLFITEYCRVHMHTDFFLEGKEAVLESGNLDFFMTILILLSAVVVQD